MNNTLTHLSLFSGIGGLDLAAEWAGFQTIGQCEFADYPTAVLTRHWPSVPKWRDIRALTKESFYERTHCSNPTIISGGFPCQPFSVAGKQKGKEDDRYLWPEMLRVIDELHPNWVIGENVSGLVRIALDDILDSLEAIGYSARAYCFTAQELGALFKGERIAIVASPNDRCPLCGGTNNFKQMIALRDAGIISEEERRNLTQGNGGHSNPALMEWLMGFPIEWTALNVSATQ